MKPRAWVSSVTFSDNTTIAFGKDDIVIVVGPNNCGKSEALRGIEEKFQQPTAMNPVVKDIAIEREGTVDDLEGWLNETTKHTDNPDGYRTFRSLGAQVHGLNARTSWPKGPLRDLGRFFCHRLTTDERLRAANPPNNISLTREAPQHPIHFLQRDDELELRLSDQFRKAFNVDIVLHRNAGNEVPLYVGERPTAQSRQDRVSVDYVLEIEKLPTLHSQGDGMRSFAGVLLFTAVGHHAVQLVDEPEAFLHPPQARHLGYILVSDSSGRQLLVATHSGDVLRGALDSESKRVRVLRLRRSGAVNVVRELNNAQIAQVWSDSLLRYSNILDGLFHEKVVVGESDSDCRFYAAVMDSLFERGNVTARKPDIMFTHCGGKSRLPLVIRSLRGLEVPVTAVVDFDVLSDEHPLRNIIEAAGHDWSTVEPDWRQVKSAIDSKKPELSTEEVKKDIDTILQASTGPIFPPTAKRQIQEVLRRSSPWSTAKSVGTPFVPGGQPTQACSRLLTALDGMGIFVVPVGELEGFCKTVGSHGPGWVAEVLKKDLAQDSELEAARKFVTKLLA